jgi:hypothetical protein
MMPKAITYRIESGFIFHKVYARLQWFPAWTDKLIGIYFTKRGAEKKIVHMLSLHRILKDE